MSKSTDFSSADGDVVFLSFDSPAAKARAPPEVLESEAWKKLSAVRDNRVYVVNDEVWQTGGGHRGRPRHPRRPRGGQRTDQLTQRYSAIDSAGTVPKRSWKCVVNSGHTCGS